jgi:hypothetical protein
VNTTGIIAVASREQQAIDFIDASTVSRKSRLPLGTSVYGVCLFSAKPWVAVGTSQGALRVFDINTHALIFERSDHSEIINDISISPDDSLIAVASLDHSASLVSVDSDSTKIKSILLREHAQNVNGVAFLLKGSLCITASSDRTLKVWQTGTGACLKTLAGHTNSVQCVNACESRSCFASGSSDNTVILWDCATLTAIKTIQCLYNVNSVRLLQRADAILVGVFRTGAVLYDCNNAEVLHSFGTPSVGAIIGLDYRESLSSEPYLERKCTAVCFSGGFPLVFCKQRYFILFSSCGSLGGRHRYSCPWTCYQVGACQRSMTCSFHLMDLYGVMLTQFRVAPPNVHLTPHACIFDAAPAGTKA